MFGRWIDKGGGRAVLLTGVFLNLGILISYKYLSFIVSNISGIMPPESQDILDPFRDIHLPLGISFFTFQGMSYLIDIYKKDAKPERNLFNLALYIGMFPQLIAGPIVRFKEISEQIRHRVYSIDKISFGVCLFIIGFGYKILIANAMGAQADNVFGLDHISLTTSVAWIGALAYTLQIYFDFCGYSTMAVGLGLILGIKFPRNFNFPYISRSITEFWRRWHITLSTWFRDYLYIPLGGNRNGKVRTYFNLFTVFLLCGIWHGASWVFLIWGIYHGIFLIIERIGLGKLLGRLPKVIGHLYTLLVVIIGWVFFRAESFTQAISFLKVMFSSKVNATNQLYFHDLVDNQIIIVFIIGVFLSTPIINWLFFNKDKDWETLVDLEALPKMKLEWLWKPMLLIIFIVALSKLVNETYNPFIYFRF